jgi:hypothetical protein
VSVFQTPTASFMPLEAESRRLSIDGAEDPRKEKGGGKEHESAHGGERTGENVKAKAAADETGMHVFGSDDFCFMVMYPQGGAMPSVSSSGSEGKYQMRRFDRIQSHFTRRETNKAT